MSRRVDVLFEFQASLWKHNNMYVLIFGYSQLFSFLISANITLISPSNIALVLFWITSSFGKQNQDRKYIWFYHAASTGKIKYIGHSFRKMAPWSLQKHDYSSGKSCSTESCLLVFSWRISWKTFPLLLAGWVAGVEQRAGQHTILMPDCLRLLSAFLTCISRYQRIASHIQKMHMDS